VFQVRQMLGAGRPALRVAEFGQPGFKIGYEALDLLGRRRRVVADPRILPADLGLGLQASNARFTRSTRPGTLWPAASTL